MIHRPHTAPLCTCAGCYKNAMREGGGVRMREGGSVPARHVPNFRVGTGGDLEQPASLVNWLDAISHLLVNNDKAC